MTHISGRLKLAGAASLLTLALASPSLAAPSRTAVLQSVIDCRTKADPAQRLACYDSAVASLDVAEQKGDVVVVDREQARAARKQAFGFTLPSLSLFDRGEKPENLDQVSVAVKRGYQNGEGRWVVELADGAVWVQTDSEPLARGPKPGSGAEIKKAAVGSYFLKLEGQRAIRARRVQ